MEEYSVDFAGRYANSLPCKYTAIHQKKMPTGNLDISEEIRLAKKVKYIIEDFAQLGRRKKSMIWRMFVSVGETRDARTKVAMLHQYCLWFLYNKFMI